jgi:hypothetical protein
MINRDELAESARYLDARSEELETLDLIKKDGIDPDGIVYIAEQRALRCAMILDGQDPRLLSRTEKTPVALSPEIKAMMPHLIGLSLDGMLIGIDTLRRKIRQES